MAKKLILVDYENIQKIDMSILDDAYRAIIFVGALQNPPRASKNPKTAHRFRRVEFLKIDGTGKNALDFHIAFQLGRTIEAEPQTECFVISGDKGFDPLLCHLNKNGLKCRRATSLEDLLLQPAIQAQAVEKVICGRCGNAKTIEHNGGYWCSNCGCFAIPPDPSQLPSNQTGYREPMSCGSHGNNSHAICGWCHQMKDMSDGIYDDGEWMCGECIAGYID